MIVSALKGGLGNMMFQISAGYSLSKKKNADFFYTLDKWSSYSHRDVEKYKNTVFKNFKEISLKGLKLEHFGEDQSIFTEIPSKDGLLLDGYFQNENYFKDHADEIRNIFNVPVVDEMKDYHFLHVRRGDYLKLPHIYPVLDVEYYQKGLDFLNPEKIMVFSDDMDWVRKNEFFRDFMFSDSDDITSLSMMRSCKGGIIANSTFSWWGAWLSASKDIIAPEPWMKNPHKIDIIPSRWKRM